MSAWQLSNWAVRVHIQCGPLMVLIATFHVAIKRTFKILKYPSPWVEPTKAFCLAYSYILKQRDCNYL